MGYTFSAKPPVGEARVNLVLAMLRATQIWGGVTNALPGLRAALGLKDGDERAAVDRCRGQARAWLPRG